MLIFGDTKLAKEKIFATKKSIKIWDVNVDDKLIPKLIEEKLILSISLDI